MAQRPQRCALRSGRSVPRAAKVGAHQGAQDHEPVHRERLPGDQFAARDQRSRLELLPGWADGQTDGLPPVRRVLSAPGRRLCHWPRAPQTCCRRLGPRCAGVLRAPLPASCCSCSSSNSKQQVDSARCPAAAAQAAESARAGAGGTQARAPLGTLCAPPPSMPRPAPTARDTPTPFPGGSVPATLAPPP